MTASLLDRQVRLIEYLTSGEAIFGKTIEQSVEGIGTGLLRLEACFSHEKRLEKIIAIFPRTIRILGTDQATIVREFVEACPATDIGRLENGRQFYEFLRTRWRQKPPTPPYLPDVAACEFACAFVRDAGPAERKLSEHKSGTNAAIRRRAGIALLRCTYDIRQIFETDSKDVAPVERDVRLVVMPRPRERPRVFEVLPVVFDLLSDLEDWKDRSFLDSTPESDEFIRSLAEHGLIESGP